MNNASWTAEEDRDLLTMDRADFLRKHGDLRSKDGARFRHKKLSEELAVSPATVVLAPDDGEADDIEPEDYDKYFALIEEAVETENRLSESVDVVEYTYETDLPIAVAFTSDWHLGAGGVEYKRLRSDLEVIRDTPGLFAVFNGDAMENTKTHSKSASALYSAAIPKPRHQLEYVRRMAIICKDKWLAFGQGNHDAFDYRAGGVDRLSGVVKDELGVPYFTEKGGTIKLRVGGAHYSVVVKHQYTGQSRISKSNSARRLFLEWPWDIEAVDVVALAHLHEPDTHTTMQRGRDVHWLRSGSYKTRDSWAEAGGFRPSYGVPVVILWPKERKIISFHGTKFEEAVDYLKYLRGGK